MPPLLLKNNQELMARLFYDHHDQFGMIMEKAGRRRRQNVLRAVNNLISICMKSIMCFLLER